MRSIRDGAVEHVPRLDSDLTVQTSKHGAQWGGGLIGGEEQPGEMTTSINERNPFRIGIKQMSACDTHALLTIQPFKFKQ